MTEHERHLDDKRLALLEELLDAVARWSADGHDRRLPGVLDAFNAVVGLDNECVDRIADDLFKKDKVSRTKIAVCVMLGVAFICLLVGIALFIVMLADSLEQSAKEFKGIPVVVMDGDCSCECPLNTSAE